MRRTRLALLFGVGGMVAATAFAACDGNQARIAAPASRPAAGLDPILSNNRRLSEAEVASLLGTPESRPDLWHLSAASATAARGAAGPGSASSKDEFLEGVQAQDTLWGGLFTSIGGTSASVSGSSQSSQHQSASAVTLNVDGDVEASADYDVSVDGYCDGGSHPTWCSWGMSYYVDCSAYASIDVTSTHNGLWTSGAVGVGQIHNFKDCSPPPPDDTGGGGGGTQITDTGNCGEYEIDISYDGGNTWQELGTASDC